MVRKYQSSLRMFGAFSNERIQRPYAVGSSYRAQLAGRLREVVSLRCLDGRETAGLKDRLHVWGERGLRFELDFPVVLLDLFGCDDLQLFKEGLAA
jgi:hypothetical protein